MKTIVFNKVANAIATNKTAIMTGVGCGCTVLAVVSSHKDTLKAEDILKNHADEDLSTKAKLALVWPCYIRTMLMTTASIGLSIATHNAHLSREAQLMSALIFADGQRRDVMELVGKDKLADISKSEAERTLPDRPAVEGKMWCYEPESKQWFEATIEQILMAEITANKIFKNNDQLTLNQFLALFNGTKPVPWGDMYGWYVWDEDGCWDFNWSFYRGAPWIDIQPQMTTMNGRDVLVIAYGMHPGDSNDIPDKLKETLPEAE